MDNITENHKAERLEYWKVANQIAELRCAGIYRIDIPNLRRYLGGRIPWKILYEVGIYRRGQNVTIQVPYSN